MECACAVAESGSRQTHRVGLEESLSSDEKGISRGESNQLHLELLDMIKKQEKACDDAEAAVEKLERRLKSLEVSVSMEAVAEFQASRIRNDTNNIGEDEDHRRICASRAMDDESEHVVCPTHALEHGNHGVRILSFHTREGKDERDVETKRLELKLQKKKLELHQEQQVVLRREIKEEEHITSDKFVNKLNTGSQHPSYHHHHQRNDATQKSRLLESIKGTAPSAEDVVGFTDRTVEETGSLPGIAKRNLESTLQTQPLQEDSDSCFLPPEFSRSKLFILEKAIIELNDFCQEPNNRSRNVNHQIGGESRGFQSIVNGTIERAQAKCMEKDKKIEDLESRVQATLKDIDIVVREKHELASVVRELHKEAKKQRQQINKILALNQELLDISQSREEKLKLLNTKMESFHKHAKDAEEEKMRLSHRVLAQKRMLRDMKQDHESLRNENELLKLNLAWSEFQRRQQKAALEKLASHSHLCEEYDVVDKGHDGDGLNNMSPYQRKQARGFIDDLEEKLLIVDLEVLKAIRDTPMRMK